MNTLHFPYHNLDITLDPAEKFKGQLSTRGILEQWYPVFDWFLRDESPNLRGILETYYQFGIYEMKGGYVNKDGVFKYPGDPDLYPFFSFERGDEKLFAYSADIVAVLYPDGSSFVTRVD